MPRIFLVVAFVLASFSAQARDATQDPLAYVKAIYAAYMEQSPRRA